MPMIHLGSADCQCIMPPCPCDTMTEERLRQLMTEEQLRQLEIQRAEEYRRRWEQFKASFTPRTIQSDSVEAHYVVQLSSTPLSIDDCSDYGTPVVVAYPNGEKKYGCYSPPRTTQSGAGGIGGGAAAEGRGGMLILLLAVGAFLLFGGSGGGKGGS